MTPFAERTQPPARRSEQGLVVLAVVAGLLLAWGAFALLGFTEDDELTLFWIRLAAGIAIAAATVWAAARRKWLALTFLALAACITPVGEGWTWVQLLYIVIAVWGLAKVFNSIVHGPRA